MNKEIKLKSFLRPTALILFAVLIWLSLFTGVKEIKITDLLQDSEKLLIFIISRVPRTIALILVGAGMSIAGFVLQQISQNRFVSPSTSGALESAKLGILFSLIVFPEVSLISKMLISLIFTFFTSLFFILFIQKLKIKETIFIPLVGIMFGSILSAIATFFAYKHGIVQNTQEWLLGDFSAVMEGQYEGIYLILPAVLMVYLFANQFTVVGMGENFAKSLGLSYRNTVALGLILVSFVISSTVVTVGAIPFLGLVVPNLVSMIWGDNLRKILPYIALFGAIFLLICDLFSRFIVFPYEIPIGMTVGLIGGILFLIIIFFNKRR